MFVGTEVRLVEHAVGIEYAYDRDTVEVQSLGNHLRADEQVGTSGCEVADDALIGIAGAGGVEVHACYAGLGQDVAYLVFYLLRAVAAALQFLTSAGRTFRRYAVGIAAVVARQHVQCAMECQRHVAVLAVGHPSALLTLHHRCPSASVLEQNGLFATFQGLADPC